MSKRKCIGLVAHDQMKKELLEWVEYNAGSLIQHDIVCTGTTGKLIELVFRRYVLKNPGATYSLKRLNSGPLGGDQQMGAMIVERKVDALFFFWDPMMQQAHDVDVKALLRITVLYNIPVASNRSTADFLISSPLFQKDYKPKINDYSDYINRIVDTTVPKDLR
ncbi:MAG: methylglyoxal synthase [Bacteroidota bacterium]|nr:methylglyoxal synthase [Bacteroidota bacterium]MDP4289873.1 methylglyoxal synthase [Bacteroidota bacterium]